MTATAPQTSLFERAVAGLVPFVPQPLARHFAKPYVAGETLADALRVAAELRAQSLGATFDILGEAVVDEATATAASSAYLETLDALHSGGLDTNVSVKPSALGSLLSWELCHLNVARVVERAEKLGGFVRIDMEDATTADATLALYRELRAQGHERLGIVLQSRLWRSAADVEALAPLRPNVRLCKGVYLEPPQVAMQEREAIRLSFSKLLRRLLHHGCQVAIATHDEALVVDALDALAEHGIGPDHFEFQLLLGVRSDLAQVLARDHTVRVYVPFGSDSYAYAQRRLRENPQIAGYVAREALRSLARLSRRSQ